MGLLAVVALVESERRSVSVSRVAVGVAAFGLLATAVVIPPRGSSDVWMYATYGRMVEQRHVSPYTTTPAQLIAQDRRAGRPPDPIFARSARRWRRAGAVYGPVFLGVAAFWMRVVGTSALGARLGFQVLAALSVALCLVLLARGRSSEHRWLSLVVVGCHPIVIAFVVNGGHADALVGALILVAALLADRGRLAGAGAVIGLAASVKATAGLALLGLVVWAWRREGWRRSLAAGAAGLLVAGLPLLLVGGRVALRPLLAARNYASRASIWQFLSFLRGRPVMPGTAAFVLVVVLGAGLAWRFASKDGPPPGNGSDAAAWTGVASAVVAPLVVFALVAPYVLPWYLCWAIAASQLAMPLLARLLLGLMTLEVLVYAYVPGRTGLSNAVVRVVERSLGAFELAALLALLVMARPVRRAN